MDSLCECRNSSDYTNLWPLLKLIEGQKIVCMKLSKALSHAFEREEKGTVLGNIEARLTRNL